jgi:hypothetical protein
MAAMFSRSGANGADGNGVAGGHGGLHNEFMGLSASTEACSIND